MAIKQNEREYRNFSVTEFRAKEDGEGYTVEGYATTFDSPYVLWTDSDGNDYKEVISSKAFEDADMSDVIFLYNHEGMVYARLKNKTLELSMDKHGLKVRADLSLTQASRDMFEAIKTGLVDQMSWAFTVDADEYDRSTKTRTITKIRKVYDVSAVSIPANNQTSISARSYFDGVIEAEKAERLSRAKEIEKIKLKMKLGGFTNGNS